MTRVVRAVLPPGFHGAFAVTGSSDPETLLRSEILLWTAVVQELFIIIGAFTIPITPDTFLGWTLHVLFGLPIHLVVYLLARRARANLAATVIAVDSLVVMTAIAVTEGPGCTRMSAAILAIVIVGAVMSPRLTALFGGALLAVIVGLALAQTAGLYAPRVPSPSTESPVAPFLRQSLALALLVLVFRRSHDRVSKQVFERERAAAATVAAAREINSSLEALVAERTSSVAATHARLSELAAQLAADLAASLGRMRDELDAFTSAEATLGDGPLRYVAKSRAAVQRLSTMTVRLHELASAGTTALHPECIAMDTLVRDVVEDYGRAAATPVEWQLDRVPPAWGDPLLIRAAVENLVGNALKFSRYQRPPRIHIGHDADRGYFVRDNGVGFDPRHAGKLFMPFQRFHADPQFEGHGLGLANVRRILQRSGGDITAESQPAQGATFFFRMPHREPDRS